MSYVPDKTSFPTTPPKKSYCTQLEKEDNAITNKNKMATEEEKPVAGLPPAAAGETSESDMSDADKALAEMGYNPVSRDGTIQRVPSLHTRGGFG